MECLEKYLAKLGEIRLLANSAQVFLDNRTAEGRTQGNATTRSALVLLTGYLEGYIRDLLSELSDTINDIDPPIENLAPLLLASTVEDEVASLRKSRSSSSILSLLRNGRPLSLNQKKLSKTGGNPTVDTVEALFECFGISSAIDVLSIRDFGVESTFIYESQISEGMREKIRDAIAKSTGQDTPETISEIVAVLEERWNPKTRRRSVGYVSGIEELLKRRNRIAHGESDEPVTPSELLASAAIVEGLVKGLHELAEEQLEAITNGVNAPNY